MASFFLQSGDVECAMVHVGVRDFRLAIARKAFFAAAGRSKEELVAFRRWPGSDSRNSTHHEVLR
jgi:hypothetical protein